MRTITVNGVANPITITKEQLLALKTDPNWVWAAEACEGIEEDFVLTYSKGFAPLSSPDQFSERDYVGSVQGFTLFCKIDVMENGQQEVSFSVTAKDGSCGFGSF